MQCLCKKCQIEMNMTPEDVPDKCGCMHDLELRLTERTVDRLIEKLSEQDEKDEPHSIEKLVDWLKEK